MKFLRRYVFSLPLLLVLAGTVVAQPSRYFDQWFFGLNTGLDFRAGGPTLLTGPMRTLEGSASICDPATGRLLFYTDGVRVWDATHTIMPNGANLLGNESSAQSAVIVPKPKSSNLYYIFTAPVGAYATLDNDGLRYSVVNMALNGGRGDVTEKNVMLLDSATEMLNATRSCDGLGYWVLGHQVGSSRFFAWLVTEDGITDTVVSDIGSLLLWDSASPSIVKFSPDSRRVAVSNVFLKKLELLDFDNATGELSNYRLLGEDEYYYGIEFSPDNNKLYSLSSQLDPGDVSRLSQFNLAAGDLQAIQNSQYSIHDESTSAGGQLQMGPDLRIYVCYSGRNYLGVITNPDQLGAGCGYNHNGVFLEDHLTVIGLPNCISALFFGVRAGTGRENEICEGDSIQLHMWGRGPFSWTPTEGLSCSDCADPIASPEKTTTYIVRDLSNTVCPRLDSITIIVHPVPVADAGRDTIICAGLSVQLQGSGGVRYRWSPARGLSCVDCPDPVVVTDRTTTYVLEVFNSEGCSDVDSVTVSVDTGPPPVANAGRDTALCLGDSLQLRGSGGRLYRWSPAAGLSCTDCPNPVASPTTTTTYTLTVTGEFGCTDQDEVTVTVSNDEVEITTPDTSICSGGRVQLSASGRAAYRWSPAQGLSCTDCPNPFASPAGTTTYIVEGSTNGKCVSYDTVTVAVRTAVGDAGADTSLCLGDSIRLRGSGGVSYSWTPAINLSCLNCPDPIAFPRTTTMYYVQITDTGGCSLWDSVLVSVHTGGEIEAVGDAEFCIGGSTQLSASGAEMYRWSPAAGLSCTDCPNPIAMPNLTTTYYVIGSNASGGCPALDSVVVTVHDFPVIEAVGDTAMCGTGPVQLNVSGAETYRWDSSPDLSCLDCPNPIARPTQTTTYYVTGINGGLCESRDSVRVVIYPGLALSAGADQGVCAGESVQLSAAGGTQWLWEPAESLSCTDCPNPIATPSTTTTYRVTAWNAEGCEGSDEVTVTVRTEPELIRLRIGREYKGVIDQRLIIPVEVVGVVGGTDIAELEFVLTYDPGVMVVDARSIERLLVGTLLEGWSVAVQQSVPGRLVVNLTAPTGGLLAGEGELLRFESRLYLSSARGTELPFTVSSLSSCVAFEMEPGYAEVDSVCGLNFRLIELTSGKYVAPSVSPNPARDRVKFAFGLGLDGPTRLEVFDLLGNRVGLILDEVLQPGRYSVEWDLREVSSGIYFYRLTSGDWSSTGQLRVEQ